MKFYNALLKCEIITLGQTWDVVDTPEMMCLELSKLPRDIAKSETRMSLISERNIKGSRILQT